MAKTLRTVAAVLALVIGFSGSAQASPAGDYAKGAGRKLGHGLLSVLYAPAELIVTPIAFALDRDAQGAPASAVGFVAGIPAGLLNGSVRNLHGGAEVLTFAFVADPGQARPFDVTPCVT